MKRENDQWVLVRSEKEKSDVAGEIFGALGFGGTRPPFVAEYENRRNGKKVVARGQTPAEAERKAAALIR